MQIWCSEGSLIPILRSWLRFGSPVAPGSSNKVIVRHRWSRQRFIGVVDIIPLKQFTVTDWRPLPSIVYRLASSEIEQVVVIPALWGRFSRANGHPVTGHCSESGKLYSMKT